MNVHVSYRLHKTPAVEKDIQHQIEKLRKRLQVFRPELIHLKGMVEEVSAARRHQCFAEPASAFGTDGGANHGRHRRSRGENRFRRPAAAGQQAQGTSSLIA